MEMKAVAEIDVVAGRVVLVEFGEFEIVEVEVAHTEKSRTGMCKYG